MLFAFPSRYWFTIGRQRVFSLGEWSPQFPTRLHVSRSTQDAASSPVCFLLRDSHTLWSRFPASSHSNRFGNSTCAVLQPPNASTWVWAVPISLAATIGISVIYFPPGTEMVHFPGLAHTRLYIQRAVTRVHLVGFLHSEIPGSKPACGSPRLIAACHVLHRLLAPRHSPYALSSLTKCSLHLTFHEYVVKKLPIAEYSVVKKPSCESLARLNNLWWRIPGSNR